MQVVCSSLVWAELIAKSGVGSDKDRVDDLRLNLFGMPGLGVVSADVAVCELAGKLKSNYNIHLPDAIHIATGICSECDFFVSFDKKLKK